MRLRETLIQVSAAPTPNLTDIADALIKMHTSALISIPFYQLFCNVPAKYTK
uniref:IF rod domain-containing protein n=1 Tax=Mesocestoides corti TaxID=53468 RepID=A0A5K3EPP6_MESCO